MDRCRYDTQGKENFGSLLENIPYNFTHSFHPIEGYKGLAKGVVPLDFKIRRILLPIDEKY